MKKEILSRRQFLTAIGASPYGAVLGLGAGRAVERFIHGSDKRPNPNSTPAILGAGTLVGAALSAAYGAIESQRIENIRERIKQEGENTQVVDEQEVFSAKRAVKGAKIGGITGAALVAASLGINVLVPETSQNNMDSPQAVISTVEATLFTGAFGAAAGAAMNTFKPTSQLIKSGYNYFADPIRDAVRTVKKIPGFLRKHKILLK